MFANIFKGRRILVTGHTGFKGSWMSMWLSLVGAEVVGLSLDPNDDQRLFEQLGLESQLAGDFRVDICDRRVVEQAIHKARPEFVFHLAAQPLVRESYAAPAETFETNVQGVVNLLDAIRSLEEPCVVVVATTDKCYENNGSGRSYAEDDRLGGHDPYSASKACAEMVVASYRNSFFSNGGRVRLASARAGNVVGGGDWSCDRLVPDCIRALRAGEPIAIRNKLSTRPWQHVLEPLSGYLWLGAALARPELVDRDDAVPLCGAFNFGPLPSSNRTVVELVDAVLKSTPGSWRDVADTSAPHEAALLGLSIEKARRCLRWSPTWDFSETVARTVDWYVKEEQGADVKEVTRQQIGDYAAAARKVGLRWADDE